MNQPSPTPNKGSKSYLGILLVILLVVAIGGGLYYYLAIYAKKATTSATTPSTKTSSSSAADTSAWLTYAQTPGAEEAAEGNSAVKFTIDYPGNWNSKVLDDEAKAQGAGNVLHMVDFAAGPKENITMMYRDLSITAESTTIDEFYQPIENAYKESGKTGDITKTESTAGGQRMVELVDKNGPLYVAVQSPGSWILVFESETSLSDTIDMMLATLKF